MAGTALCNVVLDHHYDGATVWLDLDAPNASRRYILASGGSKFDIWTVSTRIFG